MCILHNALERITHRNMTFPPVFLDCRRVNHLDGLLYICQKNRSAGDGTTSAEEERETRTFYIYQACDQINRSSPRNELPFFFFCHLPGLPISPPFFLPLHSTVYIFDNQYARFLSNYLDVSLSLPPILQSFLYEISIERIDRPQSRRNSRVMKNHKRERETGEEPEISI
jgi:hypothetical protein